MDKFVNVKARPHGGMVLILVSRLSQQKEMGYPISYFGKNNFKEVYASRQPLLEHGNGHPLMGRVGKGKPFKQLLLFRRFNLDKLSPR